MLNIKHFVDTDGHRVEIDQRNVCEAYVDSTSDSRSIVIVSKDAAAVHLGIGVLDEIECWLGFKEYGGLPFVTARGGVLAGHEVGFRNVTAHREVLRESEEVLREIEEAKARP